MRLTILALITLISLIIEYCDGFIIDITSGGHATLSASCLSKRGKINIRTTKNRNRISEHYLIPMSEEYQSCFANGIRDDKEIISIAEMKDLPDISKLTVEAFG